MKTYRQFIIDIQERYYEPNEKLPSGKTPLEKATQKSKTRAKTIARQSPQNQERWAKQYDKTRTHVSHGADNKDYNPNVSHKHKDAVHVRADKHSLGVHHKPSKIWFSSDRNDDGSHTIQWGHTNRHSMSRAEKIKLARTAERVYDKHVSHRLPHGSIVHNSPSASYDKRGSEKPINRRSELYKKKGGFGELDSEGDQFGKVGRNPSPKQKKKGATRIKPLDPKKTKEYLGWNDRKDYYDDDED